MPTNPDDAAFARPHSVDAHRTLIKQAQAGLTKREYFAAKALQGLLASPAVGGSPTHLLAEWAVGAADALIEALGKEQR